MASWEKSGTSTSLECAKNAKQKVQKRKYSAKTIFTHTFNSIPHIFIIRVAHLGAADSARMPSATHRSLSLCNSMYLITIQDIFRGLEGGTGDTKGRLDYFTESRTPPSYIHCDRYMMTQGTNQREAESWYTSVARNALGVISVSVVEMCLWRVVSHTSEIAPQGWAAGQHTDNVRKQ